MAPPLPGFQQILEDAMKKLEEIENAKVICLEQASDKRKVPATK